MHSDSHEITLGMKAQTYAKWLQSPDDTEAASWKRTIDYLEDHGIDLTIAGKYHLGWCARTPPGDDRFKGMLAIPYVTRAGVVAIKYRCTDGWLNSEHDCRALGHAKYSQHYGQESRLYNADAFFGADTTIGIAEGEIDAIAASEHVGLPCLGAPGALQQWQSHGKIWKIALKDYDRIAYFADGDEAGLTAGRTIVADLGAKGILVKCATGEDVASTVRKGDAMKLRTMAGL